MLPSGRFTSVVTILFALASTGNAAPSSALEERATAATLKSLSASKVATFDPGAVPFLAQQKSTLLPSTGCVVVVLYNTLPERATNGSKVNWIEFGEPDSAWATHPNGLAPWCASGTLPSEAYQFPSNVARFTAKNSVDEKAVFVILGNLRYFEPWSSKDWTPWTTVTDNVKVLYNKGGSSGTQFEEKIKRLWHAGSGVKNPHRHWPNDAAWTGTAAQWKAGKQLDWAV